MLLNITETLWKLWIGAKIDDNADEHDQRLSKASVSNISVSLERARPEIPSYLGHAPCCIDNHFNSYKAAEWEAWLKYYGIPLLDQNLDDEMLLNFSQLSRIYTLVTQHSIELSELRIIETLSQSFIQGYERLYYRDEPRRLPVCTVNVHYLAHLAAHVQDCGPARYWWQFPMERYCGIIKPMARSKSQLSTSIGNAVVITELLHHSQFLRKPPPPGLIPMKYPVLLNPLRRTELTDNALRKLAYFLNVEDGFQPVLFHHCQLNSDLTVSSKSSQHCNDINW